MPFRGKNFSKYEFTTFSPTNGVIEAAIGDTIVFSLQIKSPEKKKRISPDPFADSTSYASWPLSAFLQPENEKNNTVYYSYVVKPGREWVHLVYNNDIVMRYHINANFKNNETTAGK